jgi:hypothetical protein
LLIGLAAEAITKLICAAACKHKVRVTVGECWGQQKPTAVFGFAALSDWGFAATKACDFATFYM